MIMNKGGGGAKQKALASIIGTFKDTNWRDLSNYTGGTFFFKNNCCLFPRSYGSNGWFKYYYSKPAFGRSTLSQVTMPFQYGYSSSMCIYEDNLYIITKTSTSSSDRAFYKYNGTTWTQLATPEAHGWRGTMIGAAGKIYVCDTEGYTRVTIYNISSNTWGSSTTSTTLNSALHTLVYTGSILYGIGYYNSKNHLYTINTSTGALTDKGTIPADSNWDGYLFYKDNLLKCYCPSSLDGSDLSAIYSYNGSSWTKESETWLAGMVPSIDNWINYDGKTIISFGTSSAQGLIASMLFDI